MPNSHDPEMLYISGCAVLRDEFDKFIQTEVGVTTGRVEKTDPTPRTTHWPHSADYSTDYSADYSTD